MAYKYLKLPCEVCGIKESFNDEHDIKQLHWHILAWDIGTNTPRITCPKCDYPVNKISKKEIV